MVMPELPFDKLYKVYADMEKEIKSTKWYQFVRRSRLKRQLLEMRCEGARIGFETAIAELEQCGMLKRIK